MAYPAHSDETIEIRRVRTDEDLDAVFALRYRAYHAAGSIPTNATRRFSDAFDRQAHVVTFLVLRGGHPVASTRTLATRGDHLEKLTVHAAFGAHMTHYQASQVVVEANRFVIEPEHQCSRELLYAIMKANVLRCELEQANVFVAGIRAEHMAFYRRVLRMRVASPPACYPGLSVEMSLMEVNYHQHIAAVRRSYPQLEVTHHDIDAFLTTDHLPTFTTV